ncbi:MAG: hypothetical protein WCH34_12720 [Bacteroidota bacterium]
MGLIREPADDDFMVDSRPLTTEEKEAISNYIREYKAKHPDEQKAMRSSQRKKKEKPDFIFNLLRGK